MIFAALVPLAYIGGAGGVPWVVRLIEYGIPVLAAVVWFRARDKRPVVDRQQAARR
jgi:hypothetical protein